jgi:hypothetical protein
MHKKLPKAFAGKYLADQYGLAKGLLSNQVTTSVGLS